LNFANRLLKNTQISNCMKICPVGAELFCAGRKAGRQAGMMELIVALCNSVNMPENGMGLDRLFLA
jgi:hypothetical protein